MFKVPIGLDNRSLAKKNDDVIKELHQLEETLDQYQRIWAPQFEL